MPAMAVSYSQFITACRLNNLTCPAVCTYIQNRCGKGRLLYGAPLAFLLILATLTSAFSDIVVENRFPFAGQFLVDMLCSYGRTNISNQFF